MSASGPAPLELLVALLSRPGAPALRSLADPALHGAVVAAIRRGDPAARHPALAGHRPDPFTTRRVVALDAAVRDLARAGSLRWDGRCWRLSARERMAVLREGPAGVRPADLASLDSVVSDWRFRADAQERRDAARSERARAPQPPGAALHVSP